MMHSGRRFSPGGMRQFNPGSINRGGSNRGDRFTRFGNNPRFGESRNGFARRDGTFANNRNGAGRFRNGNNLPANWRNHVAARHSGNWHRDWDRGRDHWWHGHRCRFVNGSWVIFDLGFYPWSYGYPYGYAYNYYPFGYGSGYYDYDPGYYDSGAYDDEEYYDQNAYDPSDSSVTSAQQRLARQGYYRGEIDGVLGAQTRRGIARYQRDHGLRSTGHLTPGTLAALGLHRVASY